MALQKEIDEVLELWADDGLDEDIVEDGDWVDDGKYSFRTSIVKHNDKYFEISESRSGSYFTDYHYDDPEAYEVTPEIKMVEVTTWNRI